MINLLDYDTIIVDLDGTLYYQQPVRLAMALTLARRFYRMKEILVVRKYRKLYAQGLSEEDRLARLPETAPRIIRDWMILRPLPFLKKYKDLRLIALLSNCMEHGKKVLVYSDYPVTEKLQALGFHPDAAFSAEDIGCLKPDHTGILQELHSRHLSLDTCLVIGDRDDKDGQLARNLGCNYLILSASPSIRQKQYF